MDCNWEEPKHLDTAITGDVNTTPVVTLLNGIAQGSDNDQRIGNRVVMTGVDIRLHVTNEVSVKDRLSQMRLILVYDTQTNGTALTTTDVLDAVTIESQHNWDNDSRFQVIYDSVRALNTFGGTATSVDVYHWFYAKHFQLNHYVRWNGSGATVTSMTWGSLYLIYFGPDAASASDFDVNGTARLTYVDY